MPKIPRDVSGLKLAKLLEKYNYRITRQTGSHIRLVSNYNKDGHRITIPSHVYIKIGTLNNILRDVSNYIGITKDELVNSLFNNE